MSLVLEDAWFKKLRVFSLSSKKRTAYHGHGGVLGTVAALREQYVVSDSFVTTCRKNRHGKISRPGIERVFMLKPVKLSDACVYMRQAP